MQLQILIFFLFFMGILTAPIVFRQVSNNYSETQFLKWNTSKPLNFISFILIVFSFFMFLPHLVIGIFAWLDFSLFGYLFIGSVFIFPTVTYKFCNSPIDLKRKNLNIAILFFNYFMQFGSTLFLIFGEGWNPFQFDSDNLYFIVLLILPIPSLLLAGYWYFSSNPKTIGE